MKQLLLSLLVLTATSLCGQTTFQKSITTSQPNFQTVGTVTSSGDYLLAGSGMWCYLAKLAPNGLIKFRKYLPVGDGTTVASVVATPNAYYVLGTVYIWQGTSSALDKTNLLFVKTDTSGNIIFQALFGKYYFDYYDSNDFNVLNDGSILSAFGLSAPGFPGFAGLLKLDPQGNITWKRRYIGITTYISQYLSKPMHDGIALLSGTTTQGAGATDIYYLKTDSLGYPVSAKTFGTVNDDVLQDVKVTADSGLLMLGYTKVSASDTDIYLIKTDKTGALQWSKTIGTNNATDIALKVTQTADNGFVLSGWRRTQNNMLTDGLLIKTDSMGNPEWAHQMGGANSDYFHTATPTQDKGYFLAGATASFGTTATINTAIYIAKTDSTGSTPCNTTSLTVTATNANTVETPTTLPAIDTIKGVMSQLYQNPINGGGVATALCPACQSPSVPIVTANHVTTFCYGDTVRLTSSPALSYQWSNGSTSNNVLIGTNGSYSVTTMDSNGCTASSAPFTVIVYPLPIATITRNDDTLIAPAGLNYYQWTFNSNYITGANSQTYVATATGQYTVIVYDTNGCVSESPFYYYTVGISDPETPISLYPNPSTGSFSMHSYDVGTLILTDQQGRTVGSYKIVAGDNTISFDTGLPDGLYFARLRGRNERANKSVKILLRR